jgi:hypothetical protein
VPDDREDGEAVGAEACAFARYLVGRVPPPELVDRYGQACRQLFADPAPRDQEALVAFARRHAWSVGLLDAAAGWLQPAGRLRGKLLVMAAILETSPEFAEEFLPRRASLPVLLWALLLQGLRAGAGIAAGLPLYAFVVRQRA